MGLALTDVMANRVVRILKETNEDKNYIFESAVEFNKGCSLPWGVVMSNAAVRCSFFL